MHDPMLTIGKTNTHSVTRRLLSIDEAAIYTGVSVYTLYKMVSQRRIPYIKVGSRLKFDLALLDGWLKQHTVLPIISKVD